jgi:hypothetical protein
MDLIIDWFLKTRWWMVFGTGSLGLVIGWLVWEFLNRTEKFALKALSTIASLVAGGGTILIWRVAKDSPLPDEANAYFIGIFLSVLMLGLLKYKPPPEDAGA